MQNCDEMFKESLDKLRERFPKYTFHSVCISGTYYLVINGKPYHPHDLEDYLGECRRLREIKN